MSKGNPIHMSFAKSDPSRAQGDECLADRIDDNQEESLIFSQLLAAVALLVVLPYLVLCADRINTVAYWCALPVMLYGLWRGFMAWQYTKAFQEYKLSMREEMVNHPVRPKLFWNYDHFVFPVVVVILLLLGYFQFCSDKRTSTPLDAASSLNYVSPPRPVPSPEPSVLPAPVASGSTVGRIGSTADGLAPLASSGRQDAHPGASALRLPQQWKPAGAGATRSLRVEGDHIYGQTILREEDLRAGNSIVMEVKKRGGKYVGETTLHLVSRTSGQGCTIHWPTELSTVTPDRIEGRSMIPPGSATLDWNTCSYSMPPEWKLFTWLPVK